MIDLLNSYFVPVYLRNHDYSEGGPATVAEKSEKNRIYQAALQAGLPAGTVCIYLLDSNAHPLDTAPLNQPEATNPDRLAEKLSRVVQQLKIVKANAVVSPKAQSVPRQSDPGSAIFHLTARYLQPAGDELVKFDTESVLGTQKGGNWGDLPSEAWIVLTASESSKLLPPPDVRVGTSWELDGEVSAKLLRHFFPPTENTDVEKNRIDQYSLQGRIESIEKGVVKSSLHGRLKMKHPFYHRDDNNFVDTGLNGYLTFDLKDRRLHSFRVVTDKAKYGGNVNGEQSFGVALQLIP